MTNGLILELAQAGLAGIGMYGLWMGSRLLQQIIQQNNKGNLNHEDYTTMHRSVLYFLIASVIVALMAGVLEVVKMQIKPQNTISLKIDSYNRINEEILKPKLNHKSKILKLTKEGEATATVEPNDFIFIEMPELLAELESREQTLKYLKIQLNNSLPKTEAAHDDPN